MATTPPKPHACSILIVDDDSGVREVVSVALRADGYQIATCANGRDALNYLRSHAETCAIVLDLMLPIMEGAQFRAAQLRDRSLAWIPVIVMSGAPEGAYDARRLGARAFVRKPLDLDDLRQALRQIPCVKRQPERELRTDRADGS